MRNNATRPGAGHVIMIAGVAVGWLVLFGVNLALYEPTAGWWVRAVFSGLLVIASAAFAVVLWRRYASR